MAIRKANGGWEGGLKDGSGRLALESGAFEGPFSFGTRFGDDAGTNPEELIGAALAGCFSMALTAGLEKAGYKPNAVHCDASVNIEKTEGGFEITGIELAAEADVPDVESDKFKSIAEETKKACPVSKALAGTEIKLKAELGELTS